MTLNWRMIALSMAPKPGAVTRPVGVAILLLGLLPGLAFAAAPPDSGQAFIFEDGVGAAATDRQPQVGYEPAESPVTAASTSSSGSGSGLPPEPESRYVDSLCGMVTDAPGGRGSRAPQPPSPARILDRVIELVAAPELELAPSEIGLTGLETFVWVERPAPVAVSAAAGATTVDARAFATQYLWDWGDGDDTLTHDPGRPWSRFGPGSIGHLYETRGRYELSVEVVWEAQWRIDGGAWQALGFFSLSDSVDYPVRQVQARLTRTSN